MGRLFGTDGVRGIANGELTPELAFQLGKAGAYVLEKRSRGRRKKKSKVKPKILIGKDTRISGDMLESAMVAGFCSVGANVEIVGVIPTPAIAYLVRKYGANAGVVISASHNPYEYNGIKYFNNQGFKLPDDVEDEIEEHIKRDCKLIPKVTHDDVGTYTKNEQAKNDYVEFLKSTVNFKSKTKAKSIKIALDCANGATSEVAPKVFEELGLRTRVIYNNPDGKNINRDCGSTHLDRLKEYVVKHKCDIGLAFDGDGDRLLAVDEKGEMMTGDTIMAIIGLYLKSKNKLEKNTIVATVMSNLGLSIFGKNNDVNIEKTKVGDRYVLEEMLKSGYTFGGEQSGHIIFLEHNTTGDGILTALQLVSILIDTGKKPSELSNILKIYPQVLVNAKVRNEYKENYKNDAEIQKLIHDLEAEFKDEGRVLIRTSGTEPLVRIMIEGNDIDYMTEKAIELAEKIERKFL